jgi:hypothetical protein
VLPTGDSATSPKLSVFEIASFRRRHREASMHLRAAVGDSGWVEWDANPNPILDRVADQLPQVDDGHVRLADVAGLGLVPDLSLIVDLVTWHSAVR